MGKILRPHGVKGALRVRSFMENPHDIFNQICFDQEGKTYQLKLLFPDKLEFVCEIEGINNRDDADKVKGLEFLLPRETLPDLEEDTYYHADLVGLTACLENGDKLGKILAVHNFGAGDMLDIEGYGDLVPFQDPFIRKVDLNTRSIVIDLPTYV